MNKVAALVVTYNRLESLKVTINALLSQSLKLYKILVVNNGSTDGTQEWLNSQSELIVINQANLGGAGGFATGLKKVLELDVEWVYCMDDDGVPHFDALNKLVNIDLPVPSLRNSTVIDIIDRETIVFKIKNYKKIFEITEPVIKGWANPFNGTLIHLDIIKTIGVPVKDLFIWGDENEYFNRIKYKGKFPVFNMRDSLHYHPRNAAMFYQQDWDVRSNWKAYYFIRNKFASYKSKYSTEFLAFTHYISFLSALNLIVLFKQKHDKVNKLKLIYYAAKDAFQEDFSKDVKQVVNLIKSL